MAPTVSTLPTSHEHEQLLKSEKKIWFLVVPLSIFIPCLIACIVYVVHRYRLKKANQQPVFEGVPIEVHHQAWLEQMRKINQEHPQTLFMTDETGRSPNSIRVRSLTHSLEVRARHQYTHPTEDNNAATRHCAGFVITQRESVRIEPSSHHRRKK